MKKIEQKILLPIKFEYISGVFKTVPYKFKGKEACSKWLEKAEKDQSIRKVTNKAEIESIINEK